MALQIIDRRLAGKNKSVGNRERFLRRYKEQISEAVKRAVSGRDIRNIEQAEMMRTFNMGIGMLLVISPKKFKRVQSILDRIGEKAYVVGRIVKGERKVQYS